MPVSSWFMSLTRESVSISMRRRSPVSRFTKKPVAGELISSIASPMNVAHLRHGPLIHAKGLIETTMSSP